MQNKEVSFHERQRKRRVAQRIALIAAALIIFVPLAVFSYFYISNATVRDTLGVVKRGGLPPAQAFPGKNSINLLVLGRDVDINRYKQRLNTRGRSDTIILMKIDFITHEIRLLSIPRDTAARIPGYRGIHKINAAHALGGPELAIQTVQQLTGVPIDDYVVVNYKMLESAINHLGGVNVYVDKNLEYDDNWGDLHIHLKKGDQHLNGRQAIGFVRYRHANHGGGDSDFVRMQRQQRLLQALKNELKDPRVLLRVPGMLDSVRHELKTNLSYEQLVSLAYFIKGVPHESVSVNSLPSREGPVFVYMDRDETRDLVARLFGVLPNNFPVASAPTVDEVKRVSDQVIRYRSSAKKSGKPVDSEEWDELPIERETPADNPNNYGPMVSSPDSGDQTTPNGEEPRSRVETPAQTEVEPAPQQTTEPAVKPEAHRTEPAPATNENTKPVQPSTTSGETKTHITQ